MHSDVPAIHQLPPEVLTLIFLYAVHSSPCIANPSGLHPLLLITSTRSQWRQLAIDIRTLWDHVDIDADDSNDQRSLRLLERTRLWLERARDGPLRVHFLTDLGNKAHHADNLVPVLLSHAASISSLTFLRGINIHVTRSLFSFRRDQTERSLLEILVLKEVSPSYYYLHWPAGLQGFTNLQLLDLSELTSPTLDQLINMISGSPRLHTPRLRKISLHCNSDSDYARVKSRTSLPCLRLLDIASLNFSLFFLLLTVLSPGPPALDFRLRTHDYRYIPDTMLRFIDRPNITSLYLEDEDPHTNSYYVATPPIEWFSHLSRLSILFLSCGRREGSQLEHLVSVADGKATALVPNLHTLVLLDFGRSDLTRRRVKRVVEAYSLRRLIFRASPNPDEHLVDGRESGVEVPGEHDAGLDDFKGWLGQRVNIVTFEPRRITPDPIEERDT